nr:MAG TPA: hypothetical protein [Caudoviricetes sp.]
MSGCRRSLLFMRLDKQAANTNDENTKLEQVRVCNHWAAPLS